jgi:hypothetical protein
MREFAAGAAEGLGPQAVCQRQQVSACMDVGIVYLMDGLAPLGTKRSVAQRHRGWLPL